MRYLLLTALLGSALPAWAATPLLRVNDPQSPVVLSQVKVAASLFGGMAETTVELQFKNKSGRLLEGELQFPLLAGQQVSGFALDIDGKLRDAVPVEKEKGRAIMDDVVRNQIDPALLEKTAGNQYRLRIYPLPANGSRTVRLRYSELLQGDKGTWQYRLPMGYATGEAKVEVRIQACSGVEPGVSGPAGLHTQRKGELYEMAFTGDAGAAKDIRVTVPQAVGAQAYTEARQGDQWFVASVPATVADAKPRPTPLGLTLIWDASTSAADDDHAAQLALLGRYFKQWPDMAVELIVLRNEAESPQRFLVTGGDWSSLRKALQQTRYDGATALGRLPKVAAGRDVLLFTDGVQTWGSRGMPVVQGGNWYTISASGKHDAAWLSLQASINGGSWINLQQLGVDEAASRLLQRRSRLSLGKGDAMDSLVLQSPEPVSGRYVLAGRLVADEGKLQMTEALPDGRIMVHALKVKAGASQPGIANLWAQLMLEKGEADPKGNRTEIRRLSQQFGLVTSSTSLLVLERAADYVRHEVNPPVTDLLLKEEVLDLLAGRKQQQADEDRQHWSKLLAALEEKRSWWKTRYPEARENLKQKLGPLMGEPPMPAAMPAPVAESAPSAPRQQFEKMEVVPSPVRRAKVDTSVSIKLQPWKPDDPLVATLRSQPVEQVYEGYLQARSAMGRNAGFLLDVAQLLVEKGRKDLALRVLSNLVEQELDNRHMLRVLAYRLREWKLWDEAIWVLETIRDMAAKEPQSWRDLGLAYAEAGRPQLAVDTLYEVVKRSWDERFAEVDLIALGELNAIAAKVGKKVNLSKVDPRLLGNMPVDVRAVMTWDADNTDIDLWVTDPDGEKTYYGNLRSRMGGRISRDFTGGFGPEEFMQRVAKPGKYVVEANYFGERQQLISGPVTLQLNLFTHWGKPNEAHKVMTLRLKQPKATVLVGEFEVKPD
ncbi:VIT domain-containing protein [Parachitinimonas caeni]|uniref:VIT domain-containing protein n=1 Tax=Parachitinimonas caeni TaxID=3031301 RepID=A0ABT7DSN8_9NEIS|nr:VIT domain-containing protein [Parachitinimonas caeni]MDK2123082.1 VIT domain-containing protein [Parachitinimonas caeni]